MSKYCKNCYQKNLYIKNKLHDIELLKKQIKDLKVENTILMFLCDSLCSDLKNKIKEIKK